LDICMLPPLGKLGSDLRCGQFFEGETSCPLNPHFCSEQHMNTPMCLIGQTSTTSCTVAKAQKSCSQCTLGHQASGGWEKVAYAHTPYLPKCNCPSQFSSQTVQLGHVTNSMQPLSCTCWQCACWSKPCVSRVESKCWKLLAYQIQLQPLPMQPM
jgi:hypothetical protein